jgi:hypothetical protein
MKMNSVNWRCGLPVLHHGLAEGRRGQVGAERDLGRVVLDLVLVEGVVARDRLRAQRQQEDGEEEEGDPVLIGELAEPAHWCRNPISEK